MVDEIVEWKFTYFGKPTGPLKLKGPEEIGSGSFGVAFLSSAGAAAVSAGLSSVGAGVSSVGFDSAAGAPVSSAAGAGVVSVGLSTDTSAAGAASDVCSTGFASSAIVVIWERVVLDRRRKKSWLGNCYYKDVKADVA
jgi:hypothetical protein